MIKDFDAKKSGFEAYLNPVRCLRDMDLDLLSVLLLTLLTLVFIYVPVLNVSVLRVVLGMAFVIYMPGYAFISVLYPGKSDIKAVERFVFSFIFSVAIMPLIGLALNYTPLGVKLEPITICLVVFTVVCTLLANRRRNGLLNEERFTVDMSVLMKNVAGRVFLPGESRTVMAAAAICLIFLILSAGQVSYMILTSPAGDKYTEFYLTGDDGRLGNYTTTIKPGDTLPVTVNVVNHERQNMSYTLVVRLNDSLNVSTLLMEPLSVDKNETVTKPVDVIPDMKGVRMKLTFELYADDDIKYPYRECYLWITVTE